MTGLDIASCVLEARPLTVRITTISPVLSALPCSTCSSSSSAMSPAPETPVLPLETDQEEELLDLFVVGGGPHGQFRSSGSSRSPL